MDIEHHTGDGKGRFTARIGIGPEAEMTYSVAGKGMIIIDHTEVPDVYRGQGVGLALVERAVEMAREQGKQILPLCPFAAARLSTSLHSGCRRNCAAPKGQAG